MIDGGLGTEPMFRDLIGHGIEEHVKGHGDGIISEIGKDAKGGRG